MLIPGLLSGGTRWHAWAPPSLCFADGDDLAGGAAAAGDGAAAGAQGGDPGADAGEHGAPAGAGDGGERGALAALAEDGGGEETPAPADWPSDWRERLSGGNEEALRALKRFGSVDGLWKKLVNQEQTIRRGGHKTPNALPEDATEEQVAEYRKAIGIPETPDGYGVQFGPEVGADENLNGMLKSYLAFAHARNVPPAYVKAAVEWQQQVILEAREKQQAAAQRALAESRIAAKKEYGIDLAVNRTLVDELLDVHPGLRAVVDNLPMSNFEVTRDLVQIARALAPPDRLVGGDAGGGKGIDEKIAVLRTKSVMGTLTKAENDEYNQLLDARMKRDARQQPGRAA